MLRLLMLVATFTASSVGYSIVVMRSVHQQEAKRQIVKRVSQEEFKTKLSTLKNVQLIDVRTVGEFKRGTIEGAINIDFNSELFKEKISKLDRTKPTLIFCHSGGRSAQALRQFKSLNFEYVLELEGGFSRWK